MSDSNGSETEATGDHFVRTEAKPKAKRQLSEETKKRLREQLDVNRPKAIETRKKNAEKRRLLREAQKAKQAEEDDMVIAEYTAKGCRRCRRRRHRRRHQSKG
jgi:hypothetical protein